MSVFNTMPNTLLSKPILSVESSCLHGQKERASIATCKLYQSVMLQSSVKMSKEVMWRLNTVYAAVALKYHSVPQVKKNYKLLLFACFRWIYFFLITEAVFLCTNIAC